MGTDDIDERELVAALKAGDRTACVTLVKRFSPHIYRVALKLMGDPDEAEEVLQETFISACQHVKDFEGRSSLSTWLYRIATNAGLMRLRRRRFNTVSLDEPMELEDGEIVPRQLVDWGWNPEEHALNEELRRVMDEAVAELPETLRAAFISKGHRRVIDGGDGGGFRDHGIGGQGQATSGQDAASRTPQRVFRLTPFAVERRG